MDPLLNCTPETFRDRVGEAFAVPDAGLELTLEELTAAEGASQRPGGGFSLVFAGPADPMLPQAIHRLAHAGVGELDVFLVPISGDASGVRYEAVFG